MAHPDFRVGNKIFASLPHNVRTVAMKIAPENLDALVRSDPEIFKNVWGGRWVGVNLDRVTRPVLRDLLTDAWALTVSKQRAKRRT
jgi:hypothetical protein